MMKKAPLLGLPRNVKVAEIASNKGFTPKSEAEKRAARELLKKQSHLDHVRNSLNVPSPGNESPHGLQQGMEVDDSWASLPVWEIDFYERNPRKSNNAAYEELKESIRVNLILQPLTVTKRPGGARYFIYAGGNTRLQAIKELWEETHDPKYRETRVIIKAWRGEAAVLLAHMAENTQRNDMTFWDRANGILDIKREIEEEQGKKLSHREFEAELKKAGIQTDLRTISMYRFAIERLSEVGPWLSGLSVRTIQPRLNLMLKLGNHFDIEEVDFHESVVTPACRALAAGIHGGETTFTPEALIAGCEGILCGRLQLESRDLGKMLTALERFPEISLEDMKRICKPQHPTAPASKPSPQPQQENKASYVAHAQAPAGSELDGERITAGPAVAALPVMPSVPESSSPHGSDEEAQDEFQHLANKLLVRAGIGSCYEIASGMPKGYVMGFPKDGPLDLKDNAQSRQAAWWVLALASGQFDRETCRKALPEGNEWRGLILEESGDETLDGLELAIQHNIGGQGEFLPIPWLANPMDEIAGLCLEVLSLLRATNQGRASS